MTWPTPTVLTRSELEDIQAVCREEMDQTGDGFVSKREFRKNPSQCEFPTYEAYQQLTDLISSNPAAGWLSGTFLWTEEGGLRAFSLQELDQIDPYSREDNPRMACLETTVRSGFVPAALEIFNDPETEEALRVYREEFMEPLQDADGAGSVKINGHESRRTMIRHLLRISPRKKWKEVRLNRKKFFSTLTDAEIETLFNGPYMISQSLRHRDMHFERGATMVQLLLEGKWDCNQISTLVLDMLVKKRIFDFKELNLSKHATLTLSLQNGQEIYLNNGVELLPPGYFNLSDGPYRQRGNEELTEPWQICGSHHLDLGFSFSARDELELKEAEYKKAIEISPNEPDAHFNLGNVYYKKGELELAEAEYITAIRINPNMVGAHNGLGDVFYDRGELELAEEEFKKALEIEPENLYALYNLTKIFREQGELLLSEAEIKKALEIDPDHPKTLDYLRTLSDSQE